MTIVVLLFLAGIWSVVLYGYFRDRLQEARPADSIGSFRRQLSVLERTGPLGHASPRHRIESLNAAIPAALVSGAAAPRPAAPRPAAPRHTGRPVTRRVSAAKRRRDILFGLVGVAASTLVLSFVPALGALRIVHVLADLLIAAYIGLLVHQRNVRAEREMKLRFLPGPAMSPEPAWLLRRTGN